MKLKCDSHHRRVVTGSQSFLHRTGDGSRCDSPFAKIGDTRYTNAELKSSAPTR